MSSIHQHCSAGTWSDEERQIRAAFATVLQENAQLHKAVNAALRASQPPAGGAAASSTQVSVSSLATPSQVHMFAHEAT